MLPGTVTRLTLEIPSPPREVADRLASSMDHVSSLLFSVTWGLKGRFVGNVRGNEVRMRVRHAYSNGYTRLLFGTIEPLPASSGEGSRLRVEFRDVRFVVVLMNAAALVLLGTGLWYWLSYGAPAVMGGAAFTLSAFLVVELVGRHLGRRDEAAMRRYLAALFEDARASS